MATQSGVDVDQDGVRVCLFAQYEPAGGLPALTRRYLARLAGCGFRLHVACSGPDGLLPADLAFLAGIGATGHARQNRGLDFGAWAALLGAGCAAGAHEVLFANDSVFGPFGDLEAIVARLRERMRPDGLDAWGMVESHERVWHLQSWFVCLTGQALARPAIRRVFAQDFAAMGKEEVILHGELGLSVAIRAEGLTAASVWGCPTGLRRLIPVNPSHFDWRGMLVGGAVPFIKTELLRDNPANLAWLRGWRRVLAALPHADVAAIDAALAARAGQPVGPWRPPFAPAPLHRRLLNTLLTHDRAAALRCLLARPWRQV